MRGQYFCELIYITYKASFFKTDKNVCAVMHEKFSV